MGEDSPGQVQPPALPEAARTQLEKLATVMSLARLDWTEADAGEDRAKAFAAPREFSVWFERGKFRAKTVYTYAKGYGFELRGGREVGEVSFDGSFFYLGVPDRPSRTDPAELLKYDPSDDTDPDNLEPRIYLDYLALAGFHVPECPADLATYPVISSLVLHHADEGELISVSRQGQNLRVTFKVPDPILVRARAASLERERKRLAKLRNGPEFAAKQIANLEQMRAQVPQRLVSVVLDPTRGYAVLEREDTTPNGQMILRARSDQWKHYDGPDLWLPGRIVQDFYTGRWELTSFSDHPRLTLTYELGSVEFGRSENIQFTLEAEYKKPATAVQDRTGPLAKAAPDHYVDYVVAADGKTIRGSAFEVLAEIHDWPRIVTTAGIFVVVLGLPPLIYYLLRRRASRKT